MKKKQYSQTYSTTLSPVRKVFYSHNQLLLTRVAEALHPVVLEAEVVAVAEVVVADRPVIELRIQSAEKIQ